MTLSKTPPPDQPGLDPEDWDAFRQNAHVLLDQCIDHMSAAKNRPWQPVPTSIQKDYALDGTGQGLVALSTRLADDVLPYGTGNTHPQFFGWVHGTGLASGVLSEMVAATMNSNCGGRDHGAIYMERAVIDWTREQMGFPEAASGVLVSGTSQATVIALAAARSRALEDVRKQGLAGARLTAYAGADVHNATVKAIELLGIGADNLRLIPHDQGRMDLTVLAEAIAKDRAKGAIPFAIVTTAGSVDLGQFDDLISVASLAQREGIWMHVDAAFGAWIRLAEAPWKQLGCGIELADSMACDFHKWMYVPYDCGLVLIRDEAAHRAAFAARPAYLQGQARGLGGGDPWFCDYGTDLSRGNRALKVWAAITCYGKEAFGAAITANCRAAAHMANLVEASAKMQMAAPVVSNVCVFSADKTLPEADQSTLNAKIAQDLQLSGEAVFSTTQAGEITCLRAAITNHRTRFQDVEAALNAVRSHAS